MAEARPPKPEPMTRAGGREGEGKGVGVFRRSRRRKRSRRDRGHRTRWRCLRVGNWMFFGSYSSVRVGRWKRGRVGSYSWTKLRFPDLRGDVSDFSRSSGGFLHRPSRGRPVFLGQWNLRLQILKSTGRGGSCSCSHRFSW